MILKGDPQYEADDMAIPAVFASKKQALTVFLVPVEREIGPDGVMRRKPKTGLRVQFTNFVYSCKNSKVFKLLTNSKHYCRPGGYSPDETDPSGFWRAAGVVESRMIMTPTVVNTGPLPKNFSLKKLEERHAEMFAPGEGEQEVKIEPLAVMGAK